jgi:hypothetical protein
MDSSLSKTIGLAAMTAVLTVFVARADGGATTGQAAGTLAGDSSAHGDSTVTPRWINDAGILSLFSTMNAKQIAAANVELGAWRSDTVRAIAQTLQHAHAELQRTADSVAASIRITPVPSALNDEIAAAFQAPVDSLSMYRGSSLDRAFIVQQVNSHRMMASYLDQLSEAASDPSLRNWLTSANAIVAAQITQLNTQRLAFAAADSVAADSVAKRTTRNRKADNQ